MTKAEAGTRGKHPRRRNRDALWYGRGRAGAVAAEPVAFLREHRFPLALVRAIAHGQRSGVGRSMVRDWEKAPGAGNQSP